MKPSVFLKPSIYRNQMNIYFLFMIDKIAFQFENSLLLDSESKLFNGM